MPIMTTYVIYELKISKCEKKKNMSWQEEKLFSAINFRVYITLYMSI